MSVLHGCDFASPCSTPIPLSPMRWSGGGRPPTLYHCFNTELRCLTFPVTTTWPGTVVASGLAANVGYNSWPVPAPALVCLVWQVRRGMTTQTWPRTMRLLNRLGLTKSTTANRTPAYHHCRTCSRTLPRRCLTHVRTNHSPNFGLTVAERRPASRQSKARGRTTTGRATGSG